MARTYRFFLRNPHSTELIKQRSEHFVLSESIEPEIVFQLAKVLRAQTKDKVILLPPHNSEEIDSDRKKMEEYLFEVESVHKKEITFKPMGTQINTNELPFRLALWLCLPNKPEKLEFILQKATELGVSRIMLFEGEFSQMKHRLRQDRLEKIIKEAAEQSERALVPKLFIQGKLFKDFEKVSQTGQIWAAMERLTTMTGHGAKAEVSGNPFTSGDFKHGIAVVIGPEGGFSQQEKELFFQRKVHAFSLGKRILRMETAAILSLGLAAFAGESS